MWLGAGCYRANRASTTSQWYCPHEFTAMKPFWPPRGEDEQQHYLVWAQRQSRQAVKIKKSEVVNKELPNKILAALYLFKYHA